QRDSAFHLLRAAGPQAARPQIDQEFQNGSDPAPRHLRYLQRLECLCDPVRDDGVRFELPSSNRGARPSHHEIRIADEFLDATSTSPLWREQGGRDSTSAVPDGSCGAEIRNRCARDGINVFADLERIANALAGKLCCECGWVD